MEMEKACLAARGREHGGFLCVCEKNLHEKDGLLCEEGPPHTSAKLPCV